MNIFHVLPFCYIFFQIQNATVIIKTLLLGIKCLLCTVRSASYYATGCALLVKTKELKTLFLMEIFLGGYTNWRASF